MGHICLMRRCFILCHIICFIKEETVSLKRLRNTASVLSRSQLRQQDIMQTGACVRYDFYRESRIVFAFSRSARRHSMMLLASRPLQSATI